MLVAPSRERRELNAMDIFNKSRYVAPSRERRERRRSREGAWIEMPMSFWQSLTLVVAPVRERGLKCQ